MKTNSFPAILLSLAALGFMAGCTTTDGGSRSSVQDNEDLLLLREDVDRCNDRMKTMELEQQRIMEEIRALRAKSGDEAGRARLDELERRVAALDSARASDRQAIIDQVAKIMSSGGGSARPARTSAASSSTTGYEHVVKDGETLSTIAAAYKVKPAAIIEANDLKNPDVLRKGQKLFIPQ